MRKSVYAICEQKDAYYLKSCSLFWHSTIYLYCCFLIIRISIAVRYLYYLESYENPNNNDSHHQSWAYCVLKIQGLHLFCISAHRLDTINFMVE